MTSTIRVDSYGLTDVGRERTANEDQFLIADLTKSLLVTQSTLPLDDRSRLWSPVQGKLMVVADGMGGMASGARASRVALSAVTHYALRFMPWFFRLDEQRDTALQEELAMALTQADQAVADDVGDSRRIMGTTLTMAYVLWPRLYVVHAGDSRCYVHRDGRLHQITRDHTLAQKLVDEGAMEPAETRDTQLEHIVINALVTSNTVTLEPQVIAVDLAFGDQVLLCTDGLTGPLADDDIQRTLTASSTAERACEALIRMANEGGGDDNVTVVLTRFTKA